MKIDLTKIFNKEELQAFEKIIETFKLIDDKPDSFDFDLDFEQIFWKMLDAMYLSGAYSKEEYEKAKKDTHPLKELKEIVDLCFQDKVDIEQTLEKIEKLAKRGKSNESI